MSDAYPDDPDPGLWASIREEVAVQADAEPVLASFLHATVLGHDRLEDALAFHLAPKLETPSLGTLQVSEVLIAALRAGASIGEAIRCDIRAVHDRDPAIRAFSEVLLYYKGFHALAAYRVGHQLWSEGRRDLAHYLQNRISEVFGVDIHPAARIGKSIFVDHATGVVIGETAVVEDDVSLLHEVTLGGSGKAEGDRHPKVRRGVLISAGAKILGNVEVGEGAKIGAGSVVLENVAPHTTVAGVPATVIGGTISPLPSQVMDHRLPGAAGDGI